MNDFIVRLVRFYRAYSPEDTGTMSSIWCGISKLYHGRLSDALLSGDVARISKALDEFGETGGLTGIDGVQYVIPWSANHPDVIRLQQDLSIDLKLPDCLGFKGGYGIAHRYILYCDFAVWMRQHLRKVPRDVLEFGPGIGFLGDILYKWGARSYTVIDIPLIAVVVAYFLAKCVGPENIWLCGEPDTGSRFAFIFPTTEWSGAAFRKYDCACAVNCFPEFPWQTQSDYLKLISETLNPGGCFFSVNHEDTCANQRSLDLAVAKQCDITCVYRNTPSKIIAPFSVVDDKVSPGAHHYVDEIFQNRSKS